MGVLTVADRLRDVLGQLPPAERRVARALLGGYPLTGLEPLAHVADRAGTSGPTVLRLVARLGYDGYPHFQRELRAELASRFAGPLDVLPSEPVEGLVDVARDEIVRAVAADAARAVADGSLDAVAALLADDRRPVFTVGGRAGGFLADYLAQHLQLLRPRVHRVPADPGGRHRTLLEVDRRCVVVAFDYRRYQRDTVAFGECAADTGATLVVLTDPLRSPLAGRAAHVVTTGITGAGPFITLTPALAVVELLLVTLVERLGGAPRERLERYDRLSTEVDPPPPVLVDGHPHPGGTE